MRLSYFPMPYTRSVPLWVPPPARRFLTAAGGAGTFWFPCIEFSYMRGVCDPADPPGI